MALQLWQQFSLAFANEVIIIMKHLILLLSLLICTAGLAGMRGDPYPHAITSPGKHFVFTMIPGPKGQEHDQGFGVCYKVEQDGSFTKLWRTSGWYSEDIQLHYDGETLVRIGSWASGDEDRNTENNGMLAIAFYKKGKELARYTVPDLVKDKEKLVNSEGGLTWLDYVDYNDPGFKSGTPLFQLKTIDGIQYYFDITTGEIASSGK